MHIHQHAQRAGTAARSGLTPSQNGDAETSAKGLGAKLETDNGDSQAIPHQDQDAQPGDKLRATLTAVLARHGFGLHELAGGEFLVHKWDCSRLLVDLAAVRRFAKLVTGFQS